MRFVFAAVSLLIGALLNGPLGRIQIPGGDSLPGGAPSLVLVVVVGLALCYGPQPGALAGFVGGLAVDLLPPGGPLLGREALVLCLIGYVAGTAHRLPSRRMVLIFLVAVASAFSPLMSATVSEMAGETVPWGGVVALLPTTIAYNVVLAVLVGFLLLRIGRHLEPRSYRPTRYTSVAPAWSAGRR